MRTAERCINWREGKESQREQTVYHDRWEHKINIHCGQVRAYVLLAAWDGSETGAEAHRSSPEEGQGVHMGLVGKTRCPQMHGVSLSPQYSAGKGDRLSQQGKASAAPFPAVPCRDETSLGSAVTQQAQVLALKAPSPGGNSKQGCGCSSSLGKSNLALMLVRVEPGPLHFGCPWSSCGGCRSGSLWLALKVHGFIYF